MSARSQYGSWGQIAAGRLWADERATQIVEFAVSLPLLVVFVIGIFDFSEALSLKQKLTNAAREGARVAAADPANDLGGSSSSVPASVFDAFQVVDQYLISEKINDCRLGTTLPTKQGSTLTWIATATGCGPVPPNGIILTINRGYIPPPQTIGTTLTDLVNTQVTIQYAYKWRFNSVITLLVPSSTYAGLTYITTTATAFNEN
jgi:Flp pilus assembly protein TadG